VPVAARRAVRLLLAAPLLLRDAAALRTIHYASDMPALRGTLADQPIWDVLAYVNFIGRSGSAAA
jgi:hypothetical protein